MCFNTYQQCPSPHTIALKYSTAPPSTQLFSTQTLKTDLKISFIKKNGQRRYTYLALGRDKSYFVKKKNGFYQNVL